MRHPILAALLLIQAFGLPAVELRLPAMFADHMILQREQPVPVWGWGEAGAKVTVAFAGQTKSAVADSTGKWSLKLDAMKAGSGPQRMTSTAGQSRVEIHDVWIGEVWHCSGQPMSNKPPAVLSIRTTLPAWFTALLFAAPLYLQPVVTPITCL